MKVIKDLKTNKSIGGELPIQILKESEFMFECLKNCKSPDWINLDFSFRSKPIFRKNDPLDMSNYQAVSILPLFQNYVAFVKLTAPNMHFSNFSALGKEN